MSRLTTPLVERLDRLLPQTQCGQCGFEGCRPYAEAMARGEAGVERCPPGGDEGARQLATVLGVGPLPYDRSRGTHKPPQVAVIIEEDCIGCTKCIQACPVDAIVGGAKYMHSVLSDLCTGCELCISPCPVDCIDLIADPKPVPTQFEREQQQNDLRARYYAHIQREEQGRLDRKGPVVRAEINTALFAQFTQNNQQLPN